MIKTIISASQLNKKMQKANLVVLDASINSKKKPKLEFEGLKIPNAIDFSINHTFSDIESPYPNTIPSALKFEEEAQKLGINKDSEIVVYDNLGIFWSPRVWWLFRLFGHENISVLDGGLPEWIHQEFPTEKIKPEKITKGNFKAQYNPNRVRFYEDILANLQNKKCTIVDARSSGRFNATEPEPRQHLQSGNIPNSVNLPYTDVLNNGRFKPKEELEKIFSEIRKDQLPLIFSCGSGITACIILIASEIAGISGSSVYDGSWTEWAERQELFTS